MITGTNIGEAVSKLFLDATNVYVTKLEALAGAVQHEEPGTAELLSSLASSTAGRALDVVQQWPSGVELASNRDGGHGCQRSA